MNICIIPARGGSKRIPRKNIKNFLGKPIIVYSIEEAIKSNIFDQVIVSTDDQEIADIAQKHGADIPFIRPKHLSDDFANTHSVINHCIEYLQNENKIINNVCCLYPTAPFIRKSDLMLGLEMLKNRDIKYVFSATSYSFPIQRAIKINSFDYVEMFDEENFNKRSQDLENSWHDAGQFYFASTKTWMESDFIFNSKSKAVKLPRYRAQDIDTEEDWIIAEALYLSLEKIKK